MMEVRQLTSERQFNLLAEEIMGLLAHWMEREKVSGTPADALTRITDECVNNSGHTFWVVVGQGVVAAIAMASATSKGALLHFLEIDSEHADKKKAQGTIIEAVSEWARESGASILTYRSVRVRPESGEPERHVRRRFYPLGFEPVAVELEKVL